jgi:hypothetical protein
MAEWRDKNREHYRAYQRQYRAVRKAYFAQKDREYRARITPEERRVRNRRARKLPEPTRPDPMYCEICGRHASETNDPKGKPRTGLCLDHCHVTGVFRGWLCSPCNSMLGLAGDNPAVLRAGAMYLTKVGV